MTLWAYPMDGTGCGMYRVQWPLEALAAHRGLDWHCVPPGSDEGISTQLGGEGEVTHIQVPEGCTGLFIQRPTSELLIETLTKLKSKLDIPLLVDVDDDLSALSSRHPAFHHLHPRSASRMPGHTASAVHQACDLADVVIASTPALLERYVRRGQAGVVLENRLPRHLVPTTPPHPGASSQGGAGGGREAPSHTDPRVGPLPLRVGWPASIITHPDDLDPALQALHRNQVQPLFALGPHPHIGRRLQRPPSPDPDQPFDPVREMLTRPVPTPYMLPPSERRRLPYPAMVFSGPIPFNDWIPGIQRSMDIAVAPLAPTTFNTAKSWLKPLELAAAGVPFVASDTEEYRRLGCGLFANKKTWTRQLRLLLNEPEARYEILMDCYSTATINTYDHPNVLDQYEAVFSPWTTPHVHEFNGPRSPEPHRCRCGTLEHHAAVRARTQAPAPT